MIDEHELGRTPTDVEDQRRPAVRIEQLVAAKNREPRLFLGRDDLERDTGFMANPLGKLAPVCCPAAGLGRDRPREDDIAALKLVGADRQRGNRAVHRGVAQPTTGAEPLPQPDDPRKGIDHGEAALARTRDQQPAIVGPQIERAIGLTRTTLTRRPCGNARSRASRSPRGRSGDLMRHDQNTPVLTAPRSSPSRLT